MELHGKIDVTINKNVTYSQCLYPFIQIGRKGNQLITGHFNEDFRRQAVQDLNQSSEQFV